MLIIPLLSINVYAAVSGEEGYAVPEVEASGTPSSAISEPQITEDEKGNLNDEETSSHVGGSKTELELPTDDFNEVKIGEVEPKENLNDMLEVIPSEEVTEIGLLTEIRDMLQLTIYVILPLVAGFYICRYIFRMFSGYVY